MQTFMHLLTVQMANQNPLEPMNDRDFFAQLAQLGQVQGIDKLTSQSKVEQAQTLMGKQVTAIRPNFASDPSKGSTITGVVQKMSVVNGVYNITIREANGNTTDVNMDAIQSITPVKSPTDYAYLVGKQISGLNGTTAVSGKATAVTNASGTMMIDVQTADGKKFQIPVDGIQSIGE
jgi:flagellar basal-body rod modification protein FlgD